MPAQGILVLTDDERPRRAIKQRIREQARESREFDFTAAAIHVAEQMFGWEPGRFESDSDYANEVPEVDTTRPFLSSPDGGLTRRQIREAILDDPDQTDREKQSRINYIWANAGWAEDAPLDEVPMLGGVVNCMDVDGVPQTRAQIVAYYRSEEFSADPKSVPILMGAIAGYREFLEERDGAPSCWVYDGQEMLDTEVAIVNLQGTEGRVRRLVIRGDTDESSAGQRGTEPDYIVNETNGGSFRARIRDAVADAQLVRPFPERQAEAPTDPNAERVRQIRERRRNR